MWKDLLKRKIKNILEKYTKQEYIRKYSTNLDSRNDTDDDVDLPRYSSKYTVRLVFTADQEIMWENYIKSSDINYGRTYKRHTTYDSLHMVKQKYCQIFPPNF